MELLRTHEPLEAFVFDMDGTLLDSLPDLVDVTNETLTHFGYPTHTTEEILAMIGNGLRSLILQALPQNLNDNATETALAWWKARYDEVGNQKTTVYDGMLDTLAELKARGMKLAVLSNKYDGGVQILSITSLTSWISRLAMAPCHASPTRKASRSSRKRSTCQSNAWRMSAILMWTCRSRTTLAHFPLAQNGATKRSITLRATTPARSSTRPPSC